MTPGAMMRMMRTMMGNGIMGGGMMGTRGGSGMMQGGMMQGGMMDMGMAGGAGMILSLEESLDLSEDQVQRLEEMQESIRDEVQQHTSQAMEAGQAAMEALQSDTPDLGTYEESLREAADHSILAHTAMARSDVEARQLLTAEQQKDLAFTRSMMMEMCRAATGSPRSGEGPR
ncbi:MAG: Spy/CpxP family protein refolding chaperone [Gemmatimonadota bacterium]